MNHLPGVPSTALVMGVMGLALAIALAACSASAASPAPAPAPAEVDVNVDVDVDASADIALPDPSATGEAQPGLSLAADDVDKAAVATFGTSTDADPYGIGEDGCDI